MFTKISEDIAADPWFKVVEMLQQNWAVIIRDDQDVLVVFYGDTRGVFAEIRYDSILEAEDALCRNGFGKYLEAGDETQDVIGLPRGEFRVREHPNGRIYSSGRFWR